MLTSLSIKNYALIEDLQVDFEGGLSIITGETGAGKSILLGGLALVLGKRADTSLVYNKDKKCVIEAEFEVLGYELQGFFNDFDLDYEDLVILRREVLPGGKSRAFINDTPVNLSLLKNLSEQLIDIHSQHETLQLASSIYQFQIIDGIANNKENLKAYQNQYQELIALKSSLDEVIEKQTTSQQELDYNTYVLKEFEEANLKEDEKEFLEEELEKLSHVEEIKEVLSDSVSLTNDEQYGLLSGLMQVNQRLLKIAGFSKNYTNLSERMESLLLEFKDLAREMEIEDGNLVHDPVALNRVEERLGLIYGLERKHMVNTIKELIGIQRAFQNKVDELEFFEDKIREIEEACTVKKKALIERALKIRNNRRKAIPEFTGSLEQILSKLEMKNTRLKISMTELEEPGLNGMDHLEFLLSSDKGKQFKSMSKVASGGEMSRITLAVKLILSAYFKLPTIIFDEIDSGVSGEVSNRIADLMLQMSKNMQVITITHLPQVAAKGKQHYKVFKNEEKDSVASNIKLLSEDERLVELAEMLGGTAITDSAMAHARQLLS